MPWSVCSIYTPETVAESQCSRLSVFKILWAVCALCARLDAGSLHVELDLCIALQVPGMPASLLWPLAPC